jgi:lysophospholipase L1-like esterase
VFQRRVIWLAAIGAGVIVCCVVLLASSFASPGAGEAPAARATAQKPTVAAQAPTEGPTPAAGRARTSVLAQRGTLAACEQRLERASRRIPTMAIVGASFTAGVGPNNPELSWAVLLARTLHWNAVVYGVSGAGYVRAGTGGLGPVARMLARERLAALAPALVIVQAGHDDAGIPARIEWQRVWQAITLIRAEAPSARIALITVFTGRSAAHSRALNRTNNAIVAAATAAGHGVIIMNPLAGPWAFQHVQGGLHPTAAGDAWVARKVAAVLRAHGVLRAAAARSVPVICDLTVGVRRS